MTKPKKITPGVIISGDCLEVMRGFPDRAVHCCVTSPPYWGLRDYGTAKWEGGDGGCDHILIKKPATVDSSSGLGFPANGGPRRIAEGNTYHEGYTKQYPNTCKKCGAKRIDDQIGLEQTPEEYVAKMVEVFREVKRVLRDDGTLWLNLGDTYYNNRPGSGGKCKLAGAGENMKKARYTDITRDCSGLKPKDLVGIPWRVALALQSDGWYLRQDIIWHKPNPMPESVTDRCTKAHEYIFLMSKSAKYYYDHEAIKEEANWNGTSGQKNYRPNADGGRINAGMNSGGASDTRNKRSVWTVTTKPYKEAHFATFPPKLIEPCILAGCPENGIIFDPFMGAGTTAKVASGLGRKYVGIELNPEYADKARERIHGPLFTKHQAEETNETK